MFKDFEMDIGLLSVDSHNFVNLALMKLARYHKDKGDNVEWAMPLFGNYDTLYASKIFTFSPEPNWNEYNYRTLEKGGTGYDIAKKLPPLLKIFYIQTIRSIRNAITHSNSIPEAAYAIAVSAWFGTKKDISILSSLWT